MSTKSLNEAIAVATKEKSQVYKELEEERAIIIDNIKPFIKSELHRIVENEIQEFPEHTKSLGLEKLKLMKENVIMLLYNSNSIVSTTFADDSYWVYIDYSVNLNKDSYEQKYRNKRLAKDRIISGIKLIIGYAGQILIDYGFETPGVSSSLTSKWQLNQKAEVVFGANYSLPIPKRIDDLIGSYVLKIDRLHDLTYQLMKLNQKFQQQEAMELWNEA